MAKGITLQELDSTTLVNLVPHLGTTTNSGDAYSITTTSTVGVNQKFTLKFNAASTSAPTLKINNGTAYPIKKPNGNNGKVYASVYSLFWDGTNFILQGEGGGGNVQPNQVEAGFTFTNDNGEQTGTLSKQEFVNQLVAKGVSATMSDPFNTLAAKIGQISTGSRATVTIPASTSAIIASGSQTITQIPAGKIATFMPTQVKYDTSGPSPSYLLTRCYSGAGSGASASIYLGVRTANGSILRLTSLGVSAVAADGSTYSFPFMGFEVSNGSITPGSAQYRWVVNNTYYSWSAWFTAGAGIGANENLDLIVYWTINLGHIDYCNINYTLNGTLLTM